MVLFPDHTRLLLVSFSYSFTGLPLHYFIGLAVTLSVHRQLIDRSRSEHASEQWNNDANITLSDPKYNITNGER